MTVRPGDPLLLGEANHWVDIIIPTFNNPEMLSNLLYSLFQFTDNPEDKIWRAIVVNNGSVGMESKIMSSSHKWVSWMDAGSNLGWEGGLKAGLSLSTAPVVVFMNDDTHVIPGHRDWLEKLLRTLLAKTDVAAVGPSTNMVMQMQNIFFRLPADAYLSELLVGFCVMMRRDALDSVGGVDDSLPGGDDFDLSIRYRQAGWKLCVRRDVFIYHHGTVTGRKIHGDFWNSSEHIDSTRMAIIRKHGFKAYAKMFLNHIEEFDVV